MEESEDSVKRRNRESATVFSKFRCRGEWRNRDQLDGRIRDQQALLWRQLEESGLAAMRKIRIVEVEIVDSSRRIRRGDPYRVTCLG